jgi:predicted flap endonuclease-1-like 5' DNA nuclease
MATNLLWYVLAGFLLGFAASTLWEWFFFRKERVKLTDRRIRELEAKLRDAEAENDTPLPAGTLPTVAAVTGATRTTAWADSSYRSPGVFLESEEFAADDDPSSTFAPERTVASTPPPTVSASKPSATMPGTPASHSQSPTANNFVPVTPAPPQNPAVSSDSTFAPRTDQPSPADSLRAKRNISQSTRQEVLAALRRNSEAVERGEQPANPASKVGPGIPPPITSSAVGPGIPPTNPEPPVVPPAALSAARQRWVNKPELTQPSKEFPDDLSKIKGIGDVYKQRLYRAGIYTWKQITETDIETLRRATSAYPSSNIDDWLVQANKLMDKHGRREALYRGPQPDDMTKILGIGPVGASVLYRAGICTYEQLASTSISHLESLFPIAVAGDLPDFAQWIARAEALADEKHRDE